MIVVDASVVANALLNDAVPGERAREAMSADDHWAAPASLVVEVLSAIRGQLLGTKIGEQRASDAVSALRELVIDPVDPVDLIGRIWQLRSNVSAYDAAYVAAAELLGCPLLTADARLVKANGTECEIRLIA